MYNEPNNLRIKKTFHDQDEEIGNTNNQTKNSYTPLEANGSFYVARLFFGITSNIGSKNITTNENKPSLELFIKSPIVEFYCYVIINECTMIDSRYLNGNICFKLCVGKNLKIIA